VTTAEILIIHLLTYARLYISCVRVYMGVYVCVCGCMCMCVRAQLFVKVDASTPDHLLSSCND